MDNLDIAKKYFEVSNRSNFGEIEKLLAENSTYSSQSTGLYLGVENIIAMQKVFHKSFEKLNWQVISIQEEKPGIIRSEFDFSGIKKGESVNFSGIEYIVVFQGKIQHIEIRNK